MKKRWMNNFMAIGLVLVLLCFFFVSFADAFTVKAKSYRVQYNSQEQHYINKAKRHELLDRTWGRRPPIGYGAGFYGRDARRYFNKGSYTGPMWDNKIYIIDRR